MAAEKEAENADDGDLVLAAGVDFLAVVINHKTVPTPLAFLVSSGPYLVVEMVMISSKVHMYHKHLNHTKRKPKPKPNQTYNQISKVSTWPADRIQLLVHLIEVVLGCSIQMLMMTQMIPSMNGVDPAAEVIPT